MIQFNMPWEFAFALISCDRVMKSQLCHNCDAWGCITQEWSFIVDIRWNTQKTYIKKSIQNIKKIITENNTNSTEWCEL